MSDEIEDIKKAIKGPRKEKIVPKEGLSSGSALINLASTGEVDKCFMNGTCNLFVGRSNSGKSFVCLNAFAEASVNPAYDEYKFIYDNGEDGARMDLKKFFGKKMAERLEAPRYSAGGAPRPSETVEELYFNLDDFFDAGEPFIYVIDSIDVLSSAQEGAKFEQNKKIYKKNQKARDKAEREGDDDEDASEDKYAGSMGDGKAVQNSRNLRRFLAPLQKTGSILIIINQAKQGTGMFKSDTHSGGVALEFYSQLQMWSSIRGKLTADYKGVKNHVGNSCKFHVRRSRFTGREATVEVPIYFSHGLDDTGSCVDFLLDNKRWKKGGAGVIKAEEFGFVGNSKELIKHVEENNLEKQLAGLVGEVWKDIEEALAVDRKKRYE